MTHISEHAEQALVVSQCRMVGILCASIPNDGKRSSKTAAIAKQRGLTSGAPDFLVFTVPPKAPQYRGVALEFKRRDGGKEDEKQKKFLADLRAEGWYAEFVNGAPAALWVLKDLGYPVGTIGLREDAV